MHNGQITIRKATREDIPFLRAMMWEAILASPHLVAERGLEAIQQFEEQSWSNWDEHRDPAFVTLNTTGKKLGAITLRLDRSQEPAWGWQIGIGVEAEARGQGTGQRLIEHAITFGRETGAASINLHVDAANTQAIALYQRFGFVETHQKNQLIEMRLLLNERKERFQLPATVHLLLIRESKILLLRRLNTGYEDGNYSVIAGHLDGNEEIKVAMIREAREEAGIKLREQDLEVVGVMHRRASNERIDFFLTATAWSGEITNNEPEKCDQLDWFNINQLPQNVIPYVRKAIDNTINRDSRGIWFESFGWKREEI